MLVVCEDTTVSPLVAQFLRDEGLHDDDVLTRRLRQEGRARARRNGRRCARRLFNVDKHAQPRVIVSVLMLREGFDVNNICVIVPLRSSQAQILLEQTIGRGLRLMWRDPEYADIKRENRERINHGEEPGSLIDILSIVEHPAFQGFYDELMREGLVGTTGDDERQQHRRRDRRRAARGLREIRLRDPVHPARGGRERSNTCRSTSPRLPPFSAMSRAKLAELLGKGDTFTSQDLQSSTLFGDYRVDGEAMNVSGYNELLSRLTRRVSQALNHPLAEGQQDFAAPGSPVPADEYRGTGHRAGRIHPRAVVR